MNKIINVNGKEIKLRASAAMTIKYKNMFGRDILKDLNGLQKAEDIDDSISVLIDVAYMMACLADENMKLTEEQWTDQFELTDLYQIIIPEAIDLWKINTKTTSIEKNV